MKPKMLDRLEFLPCCVFKWLFSHMGMNVCPICEASLSHHILCVLEIWSGSIIASLHRFGRRPMTRKPKRNEAKLYTFMCESPRLFNFYIIFFSKLNILPVQKKECIIFGNCSFTKLLVIIYKNLIWNWWRYQAFIPFDLLSFII